MGDTMKPIHAVIGASCVVVLGLVCVLNLSSEEQIRAEDEVLVQAAFDQDDLTAAERALIKAASSKTMTPAQKAQLRHEKAKEKGLPPTQAFEASPESNDDKDSLTDSEKALIAAANNEVFLKPKPQLVVPPLPTHAKLSKKMQKAMKKITEAATEKAVATSAKAMQNEDIAVKTVVQKKKIAKPVKHMTKKERLAQEAKARRDGIEVDDQARQLIVHDKFLRVAPEKENLEANRIAEKMQNLKMKNTWAKMKAKIDHEAAIAAMKPSALMKMPPVQHKKKHVNKKAHVKAKQPKQMKTPKPTPKKAFKMNPKEAAQYARWVQTRIKHDAKKELRKTSKVAKKIKKKVAKKIKMKLAAKAAKKVPSLKSLDKEAERAAQVTAREVVEAA